MASPSVALPAAPGTRGRLDPAAALAGRMIGDARRRTLAFAVLFAAYAYVQPVGYRHAYPTLADRIGFARSFAGNDALRLFYGYPYDPLSVGGYSAWRVGGTLAIAAAAFGLLAAVRALRAEEDSGHAELVLAGAVGRFGFFVAAVAGIGAAAALLWLAEFAGFLLGGLPAGGSALLALATASVIPVFAGVGAICSQLAPTRRLALEMGSAVVTFSLLLRVVADTGGASWLRWATPLGWAELARPFANPQPLVLLAPAVASVALLALAARLAARRDVGTGILAARESGPARLRLLGSTTGQALRAELPSLAIWIATVGIFALVLGMVSDSISSAGISLQVRRELARFGAGSIFTPSGYLSFVFIFFVLALSLFLCAQVGAARQEEAEGRLETLLAQPVSRTRWLSGRLAIALGGAVSVALAAASLSWAGAASQGAGVSFADMLGAGANCLPAALLFGGLAVLAYALVPRAAAGVSYGIVAVAFLWYLVGQILDVPHWLVEATPFAHVGLVPAQPFRLGAAAVMVATAVIATLIAVVAFGRRDLSGS